MIYHWHKKTCHVLLLYCSPNHLHTDDTTQYKEERTCVCEKEKENEKERTLILMVCFLTFITITYDQRQPQSRKDRTNKAKTFPSFDDDCFSFQVDKVAPLYSVSNTNDGYSDCRSNCTIGINHFMITINH